MKKFLPYLIVVAVVAVVVAVFVFQPKPAPQTESASNEYQSEQYKFGFTYPKNMDVRVREEENRATTYLGLPADFFISLRDVEREETPVNVAYVYAVPTLTVDAFKTALEASDPVSIKVTATEEVVVNGLTTTKVTSTTAADMPKIHYLFDRDGSTVIVSVFLTEIETFAPVFETFKPF